MGYVTCFRIIKGKERKKKRKGCVDGIEMSGGD